MGDTFKPVPQPKLEVSARTERQFLPTKATFLQLELGANPIKPLKETPLPVEPTLYWVLAAAAVQRSEQDNEAQMDKLRMDQIVLKRDRVMPDLCVICLEQEYNAVFFPCGHLCCCLICSLRLTNCPLCQRRIGQVVRTFRH